MGFEMKLRSTLVGTTLMLTVIGGVQANIPSLNKLGTYDFSYAYSGDQRAMPVQVFDDGRDTYIQMRPGADLPAILAPDASGEPKMLLPSAAGPYYRIPNVYSAMVLQIGRARVNVVHTGMTRQDAPQLKLETSSGFAQLNQPLALPANAKLMVKTNVPQFFDDAFTHNSYATPIKGDKVEWSVAEATDTSINASVWFPAESTVLTKASKRAIISAVKRVPEGARYVVVGRDDHSNKEGLEAGRAATIRKVLEQYGVKPSQITVKLAGAGQNKGKNWESNLIIELPTSTTKTLAKSTAVADNLQSLVSQGVLSVDQAEVILRRASLSAPISAPPVPVFSMSPQDKTVLGALGRWAKDAGYRLITDGVPPAMDPSLKGNATLSASNLQSALEMVLDSLRHKGYVLEATIYSNRVIVVSSKPNNAQAAASTTAKL